MNIPGTNVEYNPTIESTLTNISELKTEKVDAIRRAAKHKVFAQARKAYPNAKLIIRDLLFTDFGLTTWEDTASSSAWQNHIIVTKTIASGRFVAITGMRMLTQQDNDAPPVLMLRWNVGGAIVAQWDVHKSYPISSDGGTISSVTQIGPKGIGCITESPIIISENIVVTLQQYEEGAVKFVMPLEGYVCELEGKVLTP